MKNFQCNWALIALTTTILLTFTSCNKDDDVELNAISDVYIISKKIDDATKYAAAYIVKANKILTSVSVKTPGTTGQTISLTQNSSSKNVFYKYPKKTDFSETIPTKGEYTFTIKSSDESDTDLTQKDALEDKKINSLTINDVSFANNKEKISWDLNSSVEAYQVRLYDTNENMLFYSSYLKKTVKEYSFGTTTNGWVSSTKKATKGTNYELKLYAIRFETGKTYNLNNLQFIKIANKTIKWGEN